eukprot:15380533-Alexandrium_andersonii.AAC.1
MGLQDGDRPRAMIPSGLIWPSADAEDPEALVPKQGPGNSMRSDRRAPNLRGPEGYRAHGCSPQPEAVAQGAGPNGARNGTRR